MAENSGLSPSDQSGFLGVQSDLIDAIGVLILFALFA